MFAKVATVFGLFAVAAQVAVAAPPACLIAAVNTQDDPSDMETVCTSGASDVQDYMSSNCGNALDDATSAWTDYCKDAGVTISASTSSSAASTASHIGSASASHTGSASATSGTAASMTSSASVSMGTASASSGFLTATTNPGGFSVSSLATASASGASGTASSPTSTTTLITSTGAASRLGMDLVGLAAVGVFGAMLGM